MRFFGQIDFSWTTSSSIRGKYPPLEKYQMANGHGGKRTGAGRPPGALNRRTVASNRAIAALPTFDDPQAFLRAVMGNTDVLTRLRIAAAKALLPFS